MLWFLICLFSDRLSAQAHDMGVLTPTLLFSHCLVSSSPSIRRCSMAFRTLARALAPAIVFKPYTASAFLLRRSLAGEICKCCMSTDSGLSLPPSEPSDVCYPEYGRLLPCPPYNRAPRVEHLVVLEGGPVLDYICKALNLPPLYVADLIHFGAVYYALVCPEPPATATSEQIQLFKEVTAPSVLKKRHSIKGKTVREAQKTFRITHPHEFVEAGTYLRVHVHPKRSPRCYQIDWKSRIIAVTESYVVLDKPAGTSVGGTTDNVEESCVTFASHALCLSDPLKTTHQIDNCTEGCVVFAKTKEYCSIFHGKIREKQVKKLYLALAAAPVPCGIISHYMHPVNMAPRIVSSGIVKGWHLCQLEVLECQEVPWPNANVSAEYCIEDCGWPSREFAYECKINLLTGKTHQIRAQLAACGAPIVGDSMYMPPVVKEMTGLVSNPFSESNIQDMSEEDRGKSIAEWISHHGKEPSVAIGLQACQISWDEGSHFYTAGAPWWRRLESVYYLSNADLQLPQKLWV